jgi:glutathione S-transferase
MPRDPAALRRCLRMLGLALAACEKSVALVYERNRPAERQHPPWILRVTDQLRAACAALEREVQSHPPPLEEGRIDQAGVTSAVVWDFIGRMTPGDVVSGDHPALQALSARAEALPAFAAAPFGDATIDPAISTRRPS